METPYETYINGYRLFEMTITRKDIPPYKKFIVAFSIKEALAIAGEYCDNSLSDVRVVYKTGVLLEKDIRYE